MEYLNVYLAVAFFIATLKTTSCQAKKYQKNLMKQLNQYEINIYQSIIDERRKIYFMGLLLGLIISIIFLYYNKNLSNVMKIFTSMTIISVVNYFFYILYPKKHYMLEYLDTKEENKAWLEIYKHMQYRYHLGFVLGLVGAYFVVNHAIKFM